MKVYFVNHTKMRRAMRAKGFTLNKVAQASELSRGTVARLLYGTYPNEPKPRTKRDLAKALDLSIEVLFPL